MNKLTSNRLYIVIWTISFLMLNDQWMNDQGRLFIYWTDQPYKLIIALKKGKLKKWGGEYKYSRHLGNGEEPESTSTTSQICKCRSAIFKKSRRSSPRSRITTSHHMNGHTGGWLSVFGTLYQPTPTKNTIQQLSIQVKMAFGVPTSP